MKSRITVLLLAVILLLFNSCNGTADKIKNSDSNNNGGDAGNSTSVKTDPLNIKFNSDFKYDQYNGRAVKIRGYMATLSPLDGRFIYLMNLPYQSCPFCLPSTDTIVNTVAVYAKSGSRFDFYEGPIEVTGTLVVGNEKDEFGYNYAFRIEGASYTKINTAEMSDNLRIYGALALDDIPKDIYSMLSQIDFNAFFEYYDYGSADDINVLNDSDFDDIIRRINAISKTDYLDLTSLLEELKLFNQVVNQNIEAEDYESNLAPEMVERIMTINDAIFSWYNLFEI